jgi:hypothetical protein
VATSLAAISILGLVSPLSAATKATVPGKTAAKSTVAPKTSPKTVAKKKNPKKSTTIQKTIPDPKLAAAKKAKAVDTSATRDASCSRLIKAKADTLKNGFSGTGTVAEIVATGTKLNAEMYAALSQAEQLPILKWGYWQMGTTFVVLNATPLPGNPQEQLEEVISVLVSREELDGFSVLQAYAVSRCNFSMWAHSLDNLEGPPDAEDAARYDDGIVNSLSLAEKLFPPKPAPSALWPRKNLYS